MSRSRPCSAFSRRALARISSTPIDARVVDEDRRARRARSSACGELRRSRARRGTPCAGGARRCRASEVSMRRNSCSFDISRLKKPTVMSVFVPDVLRDVQHEARLPHRRPRRDDDEVATAGARPVISSRSTNPVGTPVTSCLRACGLLDRSRSSRSPGRASRRSPRGCAPSAMAKIALLRLVEDRVGVLLGLVGAGEDLVGRRRSGCGASTSP